MLVGMFWYHLFCLLLISISWAVDVLLVHDHLPQRRARTAIKGSLALWIAVYCLFYFFYAFIPSAGGPIFTGFAAASLLTASLLFSSVVWYLLRIRKARLPVQGKVPAGRIAAAAGAAVALSGAATLGAGSAAAVRIYLHCFYGCLILLPAVLTGRIFLNPESGGEDRRTLILLSASFVVISLDHLYFNTVIDAATGVGEGIPSSGIPAVGLVLLDWGRMRRIRIPVDAAPEHRSGLPPDLVRTYGLTPREAEIGFLIASGRSGKEIAEALFISQRTVEAHTYNVYQKCGVGRRAAFILLARDWGGSP